MLGGLDDKWRPDRSKVMIRIEQEGLVIEGLGSARPLLSKPVQKFIGTCLDNGLTIFISIPGQAGAKLELNELLASAQTAGARKSVMLEVIKAIEYGAGASQLTRKTYPLKRITTLA